MRGTEADGVGPFPARGSARLEALTEPGGTSISAAVHESIGNRVEETFADAGEHRIKGLDRPLRIWC